MPSISDLENMNLHDLAAWLQGYITRMVQASVSRANSENTGLQAALPPEIHEFSSPEEYKVRAVAFFNTMIARTRLQIKNLENLEEYYEHQKQAFERQPA